MPQNKLITTTWASDAPVSMPAPVDHAEVLVNMGAFAFTENGLVHNLSETDVQVLSVPYFAPEDVE